MTSINLKLRRALEARGLRLSERTVAAVTRLIADERSPVEQIRDAVEADESNPATATIVLAAMPRRPSRGKRHTAPVKHFPGGEWVKGTEGNGLLRLADPVTLTDGTIVREIPFRNGMPILDQWATGGVMIAMTGNQAFDQAEARRMWQKLNPGKPIGEEFLFHHDGQVVELDKYRGKQVVGGRMQLVPIKMNEIPHVGSASMARPYELDADMARKINDMAMQGRGPLAGRLGKTLARKARAVRRLIPIVGGLLTIIYFADDVEAHGIGGAVARATPVLGDIIAAYDLGSELAADIRASGLEEIRRAAASANDPTVFAHDAAERATAIAFNEIAKEIPFQLPYSPDDVGDARIEKVIDAIKEPLAEFRGEAYTIYFLHFQDTTNPSSPSEAGPRIQAAKASLKSKVEQNLRSRFPTEPQTLY